MSCTRLQGEDGAVRGGGGEEARAVAVVRAVRDRQAGMELPAGGPCISLLLRSVAVDEVLVPPPNDNLHSGSHMEGALTRS